MNTTCPIFLAKHLTNTELLPLKDSGIEIISVNFQMIANCRTLEEEKKVKAVNQHRMSD